MEAGNERVDFAESVVEGERSAGGGGYVEEIHHGLGAVMAGADGNALAVEQRADIVRVYAFHDEGENARLLARGADQAQAGNGAERLRAIGEQGLFVGRDLIDAELI